MPHSALLVIHMRKGQLRMNLTMKILFILFYLFYFRFIQDILEEENITEQAENLATTEVEQSSDFEDPAEVDVTFWSKDGKKNIILKSMQAKDKAVWTCVCVCVCGERERERVIISDS